MAGIAHDDPGGNGDGVAAHRGNGGDGRSQSACAAGVDGIEAHHAHGLGQRGGGSVGGGGRSGDCRGLKCHALFNDLLFVKRGRVGA